MHLGMTKAKTWHLIKDDGKTACGSGGEIVTKGRRLTATLDSDKWFCGKCMYRREVIKEPQNVIKTCGTCGEELNWSNTHSHIHVSLWEDVS